MTVGEFFSLATKSIADAEKRLGSSLALLPLEPWVFPNDEHTRDTTLAGRAPLVPTTLGKQAPALEAWPFPVPALATVELGRSRQVAIRIDQPTISRVHAELGRLAAVFVLRDRGSYNGTMLNGRVLAPGDAPPLSDGDVITLGETQLLFGSLAHFAKIAPAHKRR
ncbi:MAG: FHA domain-containing protein [Myxococcales bacterium]